MEFSSESFDKARRRALGRKALNGDSAERAVLVLLIAVLMGYGVNQPESLVFAVASFLALALLFVVVWSVRSSLRARGQWMPVSLTERGIEMYEARLGGLLMRRVFVAPERIEGLRFIMPPKGKTAVGLQVAVEGGAKLSTGPRLCGEMEAMQQAVESLWPQKCEYLVVDGASHADATVRAG